MAAAEDASSDPGFDLDLVAAALRADLSDIAAFMEGLAVRLEQALPGLAAVKRSRQGGFRSPKVVDEITIDSAGVRLALRRDHGEIAASRVTTSGGIVIKREALTVDVWLRELNVVVAEQAKRSERVRQALQRLVVGGSE